MNTHITNHIFNIIFKIIETVLKLKYSKVIISNSVYLNENKYRLPVLNSIFMDCSLQKNVLIEIINFKIFCIIQKLITTKNSLS